MPRAVFLKRCRYYALQSGRLHEFCVHEKEESRVVPGLPYVDVPA